MENEATEWPFVIIYTYVFLDDVFIMDILVIFMVILRSTTGPYERPMLEVAYEEILFSLHRDCMGVKLGKSGWSVDMMSSMLDIPGSTPVWAQGIFRFLLYNIYVYV